MLAARADELRDRGMACILLWMSGGPSQFETFSPKPGHANGGETKAIDTSVAGIQIAENLPHMAKVANELAIIRSMTSKEGNHQRATYLLHHGYLPMASVKHPTLGANVADQIGNAASELPSFVQIGGRLPNSGGGGFLGVDYDPLIIQSATKPPQNTTPSAEANRFARRMRLLESMQGDFAAMGGAQVVADQQKVAKRATDMIHSPKMEVFDIEREPAAVREAYGSGEFAAGCLMARRLVEQGVTFVEVHSRGWDTHQDNFNSVRNLCGNVDQPASTTDRRPKRARHARPDARHLDGRVRPDAADQSPRRPRSLPEGVQRRPRRRRRPRRAGDRRHERFRNRSDRSPRD